MISLFVLAKQVYPADIHGTTLTPHDGDVFYKNNNVHEKKQDSRPKSATKNNNMNNFKRTAIRRANNTYDSKNYETYQYIQSRIYLLSAIIGDTQAPFNSIKGYIHKIINC